MTFCLPRGNIVLVILRPLRPLEGDVWVICKTKIHVMCYFYLNEGVIITECGICVSLSVFKLLLLACSQAVCSSTIHALPSSNYLVDPRWRAFHDSPRRVLRTLQRMF